MAMEVRSDAEISKVLSDVVLSDTRLNGCELSLSVHGGVVSLDGWLPYYWQKPALLLMLHGIHGLVGLEDRVEIRPPVRRSDRELASQTGMLLAENPWLPDGVSTNCIDGVVILLGTVHSLMQRKYAERVIEGVEGLSGIQNNLAVLPRVFMDDLALAERIRKAFQGVGLPLAGVGIQVVDRIVVLTGSVPTLAEKITAGMLVEEQPAAALHNKLLVIP